MLISDQWSRVYKCIKMSCPDPDQAGVSCLHLLLLCSLAPHLHSSTAKVIASSIHIYIHALLQIFLTIIFSLTLKETVK